LTLVSIITVSWNRKKDVSELVKSLLKQTYREKEIIIVDNASTDGTVSFLKTKYPSLKIIPLDKNYGLHRGFNIGVENAKGKIIIGIDHDCILVDKKAVDKVVNYFKENPKLGIIAFRVKTLFTKEDAWDNPMHLTKRNSKKGYPCLAYNGSGFAVLRNVYRRAGGLDEQFFTYHGEIDMTLRAVEAGHECRYFPDIIVFHKSFSTPPTSDWYIKITQRNWAWFLWKNFPFREIINFGFLPSKRLLFKKPVLFFVFLFETLAGFYQVLKKRKPLSYKTINYYKVIKAIGVR